MKGELLYYAWTTELRSKCGKRAIQASVLLACLLKWLTVWHFPISFGQIKATALTIFEKVLLFKVTLSCCSNFPWYLGTTVTSAQVPFSKPWIKFYLDCSVVIKLYSFMLFSIAHNSAVPRRSGLNGLLDYTLYKRRSFFGKQDRLLCAWADGNVFCFILG